jgi:hypothetical protein
MLFRRAKPISYAVCGKALEPKECRFVEKNRITKTERHTHVTCRQPASEFSSSK